MLKEILKILENERPKLLFIGLVSPNIVGHAHTTESIELRESCEVADGLLGMLISRLKGMGWFEDTLLILTAGTSALARQLPFEPISRYADDRSRVNDRSTGRKSARSQRRK